MDIKPVTSNLKTSKNIIITTIALTLVEIYSLITCYVMDAARCGLLSPLSFILIPLSKPFFIALKIISGVFGKAFMIIILPFFVLIASYVFVNIINLLVIKIRERGNE